MLWLFWKGITISLLPLLMSQNFLRLHFALMSLMPFGFHYVWSAKILKVLSLLRSSVWMSNNLNYVYEFWKYILTRNSLKSKSYFLITEIITENSAFKKYLWLESKIILENLCLRKLYTDSMEFWGFFSKNYSNLFFHNVC